MVNLFSLLLKSAWQSSWRSSNAQQFTKRDFKAFFNSHFSFIKVGWLQGHVRILLAFHKIRSPHEKYCKSATKPSSANLPINIDRDSRSGGGLAPNFASEILVGAPNFASKDTGDKYPKFCPLNFRYDPKSGIFSQLLRLVVTELSKFFLLFGELGWTLPQILPPNLM